MTDTAADPEAALAFRRLGAALYGDEYKGPLASDLAVRRATVHEWAEGKRDIPRKAWGQFVLLGVMRAKALAVALPTAQGYAMTKGERE